MSTPTYLLVTGRGNPEAIDPYMYGDNARAVTVANGGEFTALVAVVTTGGFGPTAQAERLRSGLYGAKVVGDDDIGVVLLALAKAALA